jgi:hypothetical protein
MVQIVALAPQADQFTAPRREEPVQAAGEQFRRDRGPAHVLLMGFRWREEEESWRIIQLSGSRPGWAEGSGGG